MNLFEPTKIEGDWFVSRPILTRMPRPGYSEPGRLDAKASCLVHFSCEPISREMVIGCSVASVNSNIEYKLVIFDSPDPAWFPHLLHGLVKLPAQFYNFIQMIKNNTQMTKPSTKIILSFHEYNLFIG
jgi:hypothetical protein